MGIASFTILIWDHVDTFTEEVRRFMQFVLYSEIAIFRWSIFGRAGKALVSVPDTNQAELTYALF